ncbi:MAG: tRNA guanosine-2'-O-methyltransferase [Ignavibacteria bacterium]|nr:tRNA guanosine-2'-O-methyltransferase [Ignavibacteria bacterium]
MKKGLKINYLDFTTEKRKKKLISVLSNRQPSLTVVLENINDPHNLSAVLRSCDAVGVLEAHLIYYGEQPFPHLSNTSSASASKWVNTIRFDSIQTSYEKLRKEGKKIYTTHMSKKAVSLYDLDLTEPVALVFGNEHSGVSEDAANLADSNFLIPQVGMIQSLNISVAAAVSLFEAYRQRMAAGMYDQPVFDEEQLQNMLEQWAAR